MTTHAHDGAALQSDRLVSAREVAAILGVSRRTVYNIRNRGHLKPVRLSSGCTRYRASDVARLMQNGADA
jgi:predicted DNA-binding transcriptional regulator AlpA